MLSLQRQSALPSSSSRLCFVRPCDARLRRQSLKVVAAAAGQQTAGPTCRALLSLKDSSWKALLEAVTPVFAPGTTSVYELAAASLYQQLGGSRAQVVGSEAAGTRVSWATSTITMVHPQYNPANPSELIAVLAKTLAGVEGYSNIVPGTTYVDLMCDLSGSTRRIRLIPTDGTSADALQMLNPALSPAHRQALSASTTAASTVFLQQQPALYKLAARVVKKWMSSTLQLQEVAGPGNRSLDYLLDLLVLRAFQNCPGILSADQPAALDAILQSFLQLAAGLPTLGVVSWEYMYTQGTVQQTMLRPDLAAILRPAGFEGHPVVLDPADPTNNIALALSQEGLAMLAAAASTPVTLLTQMSSLQQEVESLRKQQSSQKDSMQQVVEAMRLQQNIVMFAGGTWSLKDISVSNWLPLGGKQTKALTILTADSVPGLVISIFAVPVQHSDSKDDGLMGVELRLGESTPALKALAGLQLPIPVALCSGSRITVQSRASIMLTDCSYFATRDELLLGPFEKAISGSLKVGSGIRWMLSRSQLISLGLCATDAKEDVSVLQAQAKASCTVQFELKLRFVGSA